MFVLRKSKESGAEKQSQEEGCKMRPCRDLHVIKTSSALTLE